MDCRVVLEAAVPVYAVESEEHAVRIARSEIGSRLEGIPLERLSCSVIGEEATEEPVEDEPSEEEDEGEDDDQLLPAFEEMVERNRE